MQPKTDVRTRADRGFAILPLLDELDDEGLDLIRQIVEAMVAAKRTSNPPGAA